MSEKSLTPRIRFKGFADAWEQRELGMEGTTFTGLSGKTKEDFGHGDARFITYMNVFKNPISDPTMVEPIEVDNSQKEIEYGDIFFTTSSETPEEVGMSSIYIENPIKTYLNSFCFGYRLNEVNKYDLRFLAYSFRADSFRKNMVLLAQGISRYNISKNKVMEINICVPKFKEEQSKVGDFLVKVDNIITLHQRKLDKLVQLKSSFLEKMFPTNGYNKPQIRFKGFSDAWEQRKLEYVALYRNGKAHEQSICLDGKYIVVNSKFVSTNGKTIKYSNEQIEPLFKDEIAFVLSDVPNGKAIARTFLIDKNDLYTLNQRIAGITPIRNTDPYFLYKLMNRHQYFLNFDDGVKQTNLTVADVLEFEAKYPSPPEQKKIGLLFKAIDNTITLHQRKLEMLKNLKSSLLEKMFV